LGNCVPSFEKCLLYGRGLNVGNAIFVALNGGRGGNDQCGNELEHGPYFISINPENLPLLREIQTTLVEAFSRTRALENVGGFAFLRHPSDPLVWLNQSVPVGPCEASDVRDLLRRYEETDRSPWFEFFPSLSPEVPLLLEKAGLHLLHRMPVMALQKQEYRPILLRSAVLSPVGSLVLKGLKVAAEAFNSPAPHSDEGLAESILKGKVLAAVSMDGNRVVAFGQAIGNYRIRELAGIATLPSHRRMGHAESVIACLLCQFFDQGGEIAWLTPGDRGAESLYHKCGFREVGTQVAYGLLQA
jgi:hypothetical protein